MRRFAVAVVVSSMLMVYGAAAQNPLDGTSTEVHSNSDTSSTSAILAAIKSPVTGAPYDAQKVTRSVWTLADGTTITHEADSKIARDGEGRVREEIEQTRATSIGSNQINRTSELITIGDPVDHSITILTPGPMKLAMRMQVPDLAGMTKRAGGSGGVGSIVVGTPPPSRLVSPPPAPYMGHSMNPGTTGPAMAAEIAKIRAEKNEVQTEELGTDEVAGLRVTGKRTTTTIATGKIGNDRPIVITHEEWYSPDLKMVVKSEDDDPRTGKRTMVLEGLTLGDPAPALFKVPEGYKVQDMADMMKSLGKLGQPAAAKQ